MIPTVNRNVASLPLFLPDLSISNSCEIKNIERISEILAKRTIYRKDFHTHFNRGLWPLGVFLVYCDSFDEEYGFSVFDSFRSE